MSLQGKTLFISGGSRGIGLAIAVRAASEGANVVIAAKTDQENPRLPGTIYSAAKEIEAAGGQCLPLKVDIREESQVVEAVAAARERFGSIDVLINNASAISLTGTEATPMKRFDLMFGVNVRGTFLCTQACLPALKKSGERGRNPHILTLSPPLNMEAALVCAAPGLHHGQVRHVDVRAGTRRGVKTLWHRRQCALAGYSDPNCRTANDSGCPAGALPYACDSCRRGRTDSFERRARHGQ